MTSTVNHDLEWDYEDLPKFKTWSFNVFLEEYNQLYSIFNDLQQRKFLQESSDQFEPDPESGFHVDKYEKRYSDFVEKSAEFAKKEHPLLKEDILCRVELLKAKWGILTMKLGSPLSSPKEDGAKAKPRIIPSAGKTINHPTSIPVTTNVQSTKP